MECRILWFPMVSKAGLQDARIDHPVLSPQLKLELMPDEIDYINWQSEAFWSFSQAVSSGRKVWIGFLAAIEASRSNFRKKNQRNC